MFLGDAIEATQRAAIEEAGKTGMI